MKKNYGSRGFFAGMIGLLCSCLLILAGCKEEKGTSAFGLVTPGKPQPVIDSLSPAVSALAAAQPITVYGKNFSSTLGENFLYFNGKPARILSATSTKLVVNSAVDSGMQAVKVTVAGAELYSAGVPYRLFLAVEPFGTVSPPATGASAITPDSAANLYFELLGSGIDNGIYILTPSGTQSQFAPKTTQATFWSSLKKGPGGSVYAAKGARVIYNYPSSSSDASPWGVASLPISDIDFDQSKNLWAGGNTEVLYCFRPDKSFNTVPESAAVHALRVYDGYLYFSATKDSAEKVFRAAIQGDTLGSIEEYFNITSAVGTPYAGRAITFSSDGYMYVGTEAPLGFIVVAPDRSFSTPYSDYASMFGSLIASVAWGPGELLYGATYEGGLFRIHTKKIGAPYYGLK
jgi:IPT/TIG domain